MSQVVNRTLNIVIQATGAEAQLDRLKKKEEALTKEIAKTNEEGKRKDYEQQLTVTKDKIESLTGVISGKLTPSLNMSKQAVNKLHKELSDMSKDAPGYADKFKAYELAAKQFDALNNKVKGVRKTFGDFISETKKVAAGVLIGNTVTAAVSTIGGYFSGALSGAAKLSDELANIRKAANLSEAEVKKLNSELSKIDSRTGNSDLRKIAEGLGQVGEVVTADAVASIDKINVALGDEFGSNAKQITTDLAKLRNNLQDIKTGNFGEDILHIGNALNFLGANGLATAPVIVDFAQRMSGVAGTFGLTSGQILGTAATFEELGISVERGATAFTKSLQRIAADPLKFAKALNYTEEQTKAFVNLVNTDLGEAFNQVAVDARKAGVSNVAFGQILKELDADGSGAGEVLSKLAANQELLSTRVGQATEQLKLSGSITDEFGIKNNNLAANMEKMRKAFAKLFSSSTIMDFTSSAVTGLTHFAKALTAIPAPIVKIIGAIATLVLGISIWNTAMVQNSILSLKASLETIKNTISKVANTYATYVNAAATSTANAASAAYIVVTNLLTGKINLATAAQRLWNIAMKSNPIGLIIVAVTAAVAIIATLANRIERVTYAQKLQSEVMTEANRNIAEQVGTLKQLTAAASNQVSTDEQRFEAMNKLIAIDPSFRVALDGQKINTEKLTQATSELIDKLQLQAIVQASIARRDAEYKKSGEVGLVENEIKRAIDLVKSGQLTAKDAIAQLGEDAKRLVNLTAIQQSNSGNLASTLKDLTAASIVAGKAQREVADKTMVANDLVSRSEKQLAKLKDGIFQRNAKIFRDTLSDLKVGTEEYKKVYAEFQKFLSDNTQKNEGPNKPTINTPLPDIEATNERKRKAKEIEDKKKQDAKAATERLAAFKKELEDLQFEQSLLKLSEEKQEEARENKRYNDQRKRVEGNKQLLETIEEIHQANLLAIEKKYDDIRKKENKKAIADIIKEKEDREEKEAAYLKAFNERAKAALNNGSDLIAEGVRKNGALSSRDRLAAQELKTQIGTNKQKLQATLDLLDMQEAAEVQGTDKTENEILLIHEKYNKLRAEAQITNTQKTLQLTLEYSKIALDSFSAIDSALKEREEREVKRIDKQKNLEINGFKYQLDQKLISQKQYDIKVAAAEEAAQKKISAIRLKEWKREKAIRLANATLSGVESVLTGLKQGGLPLAVAYGLLAATQVGIIAASKPPEFAKGGFVPQGSSHQQGGLGIYDHATGQHVGTMEGNEPIISKPVYMANKPLVDELLHRGYTSNYSSLNPTWRTAQPAVMNLPKVTNSMQQVGYFAKGGFAPDATSTNNNNQLAEVMNLLVKQLQMPIKSYTVLSEHEAKKEQLQTIVNDATLK